MSFSPDQIARRQEAIQAFGLDADPTKPTEAELALDAIDKIYAAGPEAVAVAASGLDAAELAEIDAAFNGPLPTEQA